MRYLQHCMCYFFCILFFSSCGQQEKADTPPVIDVKIFEETPIAVPLQPIITETSGIADSKTVANSLWAHEDSGKPPQLYLIGHDGKVTKKIYLKGVVNRDWEDMAAANNNLYLADIGDNTKAYSEYKIYVVPEPTPDVDTIKNVTEIKFCYPDGSHDAEAILVDPQTKDIYIITKQDNPAHIYKLTYPFSAALNTATAAGNLTYSGVVSAALSPDEKEILVKTYTNVYHYKRKANESIEQALQQNFTTLPYSIEPQGEAITFSNANTGFFTLSEKGLSNKVDLYFYKRK